MGGQMTITELSLQITENYKKSRAIYNLISSNKFQELFSSATEEKKQEVIDYISKGNTDEINNWIRKELGQYHVMSLRKLAAQHGIKNYMRLSTGQLLNQLKRYQFSDEQLINVSRR